MNKKLIVKFKIKHADWPYILQGFFVYFVLFAAGSFLFDGTSFFIFLTIISVFLSL